MRVVAGVAGGLVGVVVGRIVVDDIWISIVAPGRWVFLPLIYSIMSAYALHIVSLVAVAAHVSLEGESGCFAYPKQHFDHCNCNVIAPKSRVKACACLSRSIPRFPAAHVPLPWLVKTCAGFRTTLLPPISNTTEDRSIEELSTLPPSPSIDLFSCVPLFISAGRAFANCGLRSVSTAPVSSVKSRCLRSTSTSMTGLEL